jgi:hypothetical protein
MKIFFYPTFLLTIIVMQSSCGSVKNKESKVIPITEVNNNSMEIIKPFPKGKTDMWLNDLLKKDAYLTKILENSKEYQTQIIYTQIDRDNSNVPKFTTYHFNADPDFYFYPASMVKMPIAFLALQKIKELNDKGIAINKDMTMITEVSSPNQTPVYNEPTAIDGRPTIAQYIKKIFLVSDNDAFNRLYEFLGQEYINSSLQRMGFKNAEIINRLQTGMSVEENKKTNPIKFLDANGNLVYQQAEQISKKKYSKRNDVRGIGYMKGGIKINQPFDMSTKNRLNLNDMHEALSAVIFGTSIEKNKSFNITEEDRVFLLKYLSQLPKESAFPTYPAPEHWDNYVKFNLFGSEKKDMPKNIRVFNKVGFAYGYITDAGYIVDFEKKIEFMLSITIYVNKDGIFNDDKYEDEEIAYPFMKRVGEVIYEYEKNRKKEVLPDLSKYILQYDK